MQDHELPGTTLYIHTCEHEATKLQELVLQVPRTLTTYTCTLTLTYKATGTNYMYITRYMYIDYKATGTAGSYPGFS